MDCKKAVSMLERATDARVPFASSLLGVCCANGYGTERDTKKAVTLWQRDADDMFSELFLGVAYKEGTYGFARSDNKADELLRDALPALIMAAESGDARAQRDLGMCYFAGHGVTIDRTASEKWLRSAAEMGHAHAQANMAACFYSGVRTDYTDTARWYRLAAEQGHADAQYEVGDCYRQGLGVPRDASKAVEWFRLAAAQNVFEAQYALGRAYKIGEGVNADEDEAKRWHLIAGEKDSSGHSSQHRLSRL